MKKILLSIFSVGVMYSVCAQPTLQLSDITPSFGTEVTVATTDYQDPGAGGADMTWDLSDMPSNGTYTQVIASPNGQPGSENFPNATHAGLANNTDVVGYSSYSNNKLEVVGGYIPASGSIPESIIEYVNPRSVLEFPLTYNSSFTDDFERHDDISGAASNIETGTISLTVDGYGTLITPAGTFENVLRVSFEIESVIETIFQGEVIATTNFTENSVNFVKAGYSTALASFSQSGDGDSSTTIAQYLQDNTVGSEEIKLANRVELYPNPATSSINVRFEQNSPGNAQFALYSISGKMIKVLGRESLLTGTNQLFFQLPNLESGLYILRIQTEDGVLNKKIQVRM